MCAITEGSAPNDWRSARIELTCVLVRWEPEVVGGVVGLEEDGVPPPPLLLLLFTTHELPETLYPELHEKAQVGYADTEP